MKQQNIILAALNGGVFLLQFILAVTCFSGGEYRTRQGRFLRIDLPFRRLYLEDAVFLLDDLYDVARVDGAL